MDLFYASEFHARLEMKLKNLRRESRVRGETESSEELQPFKS